MNYTEKDKRFQITEQGRRRIRSLLAGQGKSMADLATATGWTYARLYRVVRGFQYVTNHDFSKLDLSLKGLTEFGIEEADHHNVGRLS